MKTRTALAALVAAVVLAYPAQATLTSTSNTVSYVGNAVTTSFTVPFKFLASSDLVVTVAGATKVLNSDYTVTGAGNATGSVKFTVAPAASAAVVITRFVPFNQTISLKQNRTFDPSTLETALDKLTMEVQQTVPLGSAASLASLSLTAPLPMASGGTGVSNLNCGAGVVTGNGTNLLCTALSGLAPPGTTGVLLQTVTPGSMQTGHTNISGTISLNATSGTTGGRLSAGGNTLILDTGAVPASGQAAVTIRSGGTSVLNVGTTGDVGLRIIGADGLPTTFGTFSASTSLHLVGQPGATGVVPSVVIDSPLTMTAGSVLDVRNNGVPKASVRFDGVVTSTGLTSSGPISGTTASFSSTSTHAGAAAFNGGVTIGTSGTAISGSFRGTATWNPANLAAQTCAETSITLAGAVAGTECAVGSPVPTGGAGVNYSCYVLNSTTCNVKACNATASTQSVAQGTYSCRVFNP